MTSTDWQNPAVARHRRLATSLLYVLVDGCDSASQFAKLLQQLIDVQVDIIQLREKRMSDREILARAKVLTSLTSETKTLSIINDRPDIALLCGADGVHIGQDELPPNEVRGLVGPERLVGLSTHSLEQARAALELPIDYIGVGPTFPSRTKHFERFPGIKLLQDVAASEFALPAFAIGGIDLENIHRVLDSGMRRVAIQSAISQAGNRSAAVAAEVAKQLRAVQDRPSDTPPPPDSLTSSNEAG